MSDRVDETQENEVGLKDNDFDEDTKDAHDPTPGKGRLEASYDTEKVREQEQNSHQVQATERQEGRQSSFETPVPTDQPKPEEKFPDSDSKFFAIRTTGGQERVVASLLQTRVNSKKLGIRSIMVLDSFKGYIIVEAPDSNVAYEALSGIRHVRGQIRGDLPFKDIEGYLVKKPVVSELSIEDTVEVIAGPFKSMKAKITRVDYEKQEATVVLLDSPYQIPVTVDANYLKKVAH